MPDGQGVWLYDDEVNICITYIWLFLFLSMCLYCVFLTMLYLSLKVCVTIVALLLLFFKLSLLFCCVAHGIVVLVPLTFWYCCCAVS